MIFPTHKMVFRCLLHHFANKNTDFEMIWLKSIVVSILALYLWSISFFCKHMVFLSKNLHKLYICYACSSARSTEDSHFYKKVIFHKNNAKTHKKTDFNLKFRDWNSKTMQKALSKTLCAFEKLYCACENSIFAAKQQLLTAKPNLELLKLFCWQSMLTFKTL